MKVTEQDLTNLRAVIEPLDTPARRAQYGAGDFPRADRVTNLDLRYRWDLFWEANGARALTGEYKDAHIDTALRSMVPTLEPSLPATAPSANGHTLELHEPKAQRAHEQWRDDMSMLELREQVHGPERPYDSSQENRP